MPRRQGKTGVPPGDRTGGARKQETGRRAVVSRSLPLARPRERSPTPAHPAPVAPRRARTARPPAGARSLFGRRRCAALELLRRARWARAASLRSAPRCPSRRTRRTWHRRRRRRRSGLDERGWVAHIVAVSPAAHTGNQTKPNQTKTRPHTHPLDGHVKKKTARVHVNNNNNNNSARVAGHSPQMDVFMYSG